MEKNRVFLYAGKERCDVLYYLVKLILKVDKRVLVIDNSKLNDFYKVYAHDHDKGEIRKNKLVITKNVLVTNELLDSSQLEPFDYVFIYQGLNNAHLDYEIDSIIISPGYEPWEIVKAKDISNAFEVADDEIIVIPRDKTNNKISDKQLLGWLNLNDSAAVYPVEFDERAYDFYINLLYNKDTTKISFSKTTTADVYSFLSDFAGKYLELGSKDVKQLLK